MHASWHHRRNRRQSRAHFFLFLFFSSFLCFRVQTHTDTHQFNSTKMDADACVTWTALAFNSFWNQVESERKKEPSRIKQQQKEKKDEKSNCDSFIECVLLKCMRDVANGTYYNLHRILVESERASVRARERVQPQHNWKSKNTSKCAFERVCARARALDRLLACSPAIFNV